MGDEVDHGTKEPGIVGNWYIDLRKILDSMGDVLYDLPATAEAETLMSIHCNIMVSGHDLATFLMLKGDIY